MAARKYNDVRLRSPNASSHRTLLRQQGVNIDEWLELYETQDGMCFSCGRDTPYLMPFFPNPPAPGTLPEDRPSASYLVCRTCNTVWLSSGDDREEHIKRAKWFLECQEELEDYYTTMYRIKQIPTDPDFADQDFSKDPEDELLD